MSWPNHLTRFSNETYKHFMAKSCLFYMLRKMKHEVRTEWSVPAGYVDIVDMDTMTMYEIELSHSPKFRNRKIELYRQPGFELIIINCSKMPLDINRMKRFIEQFIVPD